ncbi:MAG: hypothetical protein JW841_07805 [Deltaproteobacteria bacterium]|nr:hypothetical protein [Deltaproteobacteria bacterium]
MHKLIQSIIVCGVMVLGVTTAKASDAKGYPGTFCQSNSSAAQLSGEAIVNTSSGTTQIKCGMIRDGSSINQVKVFVKDLNATNDVGCYVSSRVPKTDAAGAWGEWTPWSYTEGSSSYDKVLTFGSLSGWDYGYYGLTCNLPGVFSSNQSSLGAYWVREN